MKTAEELRDLLNRIDRRSYPAYKDTRGSYRFPGYVLFIDHVQGDPFAAPSKLSIRVPGRTAGYPEELYNNPGKKTALEDYL
ncbi:MAG: isopentenyl-diphosphate delta-isomerase, partial [Lachnospiraceae bacterium]|nr:isopentenyl-diphosphate delta-isomerase [Lachnospiraceae bacterium]